MEMEVVVIFAAGDIRRGSPSQVVTAVGDGATTAISAAKFLQELRFLFKIDNNKEIVHR
jgi:thioredoxin reductase